MIVSVTRACKTYSIRSVLSGFHATAQHTPYSRWRCALSCTFSSGSGAVQEFRQLIIQTSHGGDRSRRIWQTAADSGREAAAPPPPTGARLLEEQLSAARPPEPADGPGHRSVRGGHVYPSQGVSVPHSGAQRQEAVCWSQCSNVISVYYSSSVTITDAGSSGCYCLLPITHLHCSTECPPQTGDNIQITQLSMIQHLEVCCSFQSI